jgi:MFS family permease
MTNYGVLIYASLGLSGFVPLLLNACWTTFTIIGNTWTAFFIDRFGRRTFMLIGSIGVLTSVIFLCALTASFLDTTNKAGLRAAVFFVFFYIFWWCFFIDATQYVYLAEIFPNHLRSQGVALGLSAFYLASEVTLVAAPVALNKIGWKFYLVLICPSAVYITLIFFLFPETKGRTLEEIGALFGDEQNIASHYYGISEEERQRIHEDALREVQTSTLHDMDLADAKEEKASTTEDAEKRS